MALYLSALLLFAPVSPRVYAHVVPWHPPSHSRPDRALDLDGGVGGMMRAARAAGVDGFTIDLVSGDPVACLRLLREYLTAAEQVGEFTVGPCLDLDGTADAAAWTQVLVGWQELSHASAAAMRHDGRPIVFTYNAPRLSADGWRAVKAGCAAAGVDPFIVAEVEGPLRRGADGDAAVRALAGVLDAGYSFSPFPAGQRHLAELLAGSGHEHPVVSAPSPGYWRTNTGALSRPFRGTETYDQTWRDALTNGAEWAVITTWNDYGESTHIEPSRNNSDLLARVTAVETARLKGTDPVVAAGGETFWLTAPPELPDGPGRGPLEANPQRETVFEIARCGPPRGPVDVTVRLLAPDGTTVHERRLTIPADGPFTAGRFTWEPDRTLGVPFIRATASVGPLHADLPLPLWPRDVAHRFVLAPLRVKLLADPPPAPVVRLVEGRLQVDPIEPAAPGRVDLLHDLAHRPDPHSTTGAVARGAAQLPSGAPEWGYWSAARVEPGGAVSWSAPLWLAPHGDLLLLARYRCEQDGRDESVYGRHAAVHGAAWQATLADGSHALRSGEASWLEPPGSFLPCAGPLTVAVWCRPAVPGGMLFGDVGAPLLLSLDGLTPRATRRTADGRWVTAAAAQPLALNRWSHVAGCYDGHDLVLYVDAHEVARTPAGPGIGSDRMGFGRNPYDGSSRFSGLLADLVLRGDARPPDPREVAPAEPRP